MKMRSTAALFGLSLTLLAPAFAPAAKPESGRGGKERRAEKPERAERQPEKRRDSQREDRPPERSRADADERPTSRPSDEQVQRDRGERTQGEQTTEVVRDQRRIANDIGARYEDARRAGKVEETSTNELKELQARLDAANARHDERMAELRASERAASESGDRRQLQRARKAIEVQEAAHEKEVRALQRRISELSGRGQEEGAAPGRRPAADRPRSAPAD